jgi:hypothetical protein
VETEETEERVEVAGICADISLASDSITDEEEAVDVGGMDEEAIFCGDGRTEVD